MLDDVSRWFFCYSNLVCERLHGYKVYKLLWPRADACLHTASAFSKCQAVSFLASKRLASFQATTRLTGEAVSNSTAMPWTRVLNLPHWAIVKFLRQVLANASCQPLAESSWEKASWLRTRTVSGVLWQGKLKKPPSSGRIKRIWMLFNSSGLNIGVAGYVSQESRSLSAARYFVEQMKAFFTDKKKE